MKIIAIRYLCETNTTTLSDAANVLIAKGWQPLGPASLFIDGMGKDNFLQTLVKYEQ